MMTNSNRYILFYKPYGVVSAFTDRDGHTTLKSFIPLPNVYPVGRLDLDSEGLLFLCDDGPLAHRMTSPEYEHPKTYLVQVEGEVPEAKIAELEAGVEIKGKRTRRCKVLQIPEPELVDRGKPVTPHGPTTWLRIVLYEGRKRQIRHMTAAVGFPTLRILRVAIGPLSLSDLKPGEWRELTQKEIDLLRQSVKQKPASRGRTPEASPGNTGESQYQNAGRRSPARGNHPSDVNGPKRK